MSKPRRDYFVAVKDDGLFAPNVGPWAMDKYRRVGMYAEIFATGMKNQWPTRVYLDLFAGAGHAIIRNKNQHILTSAMLATTVPDPFSKYILCDRDARCLDALEARMRRAAPRLDASFIEGDVNARAADIVAGIPSHSAARRVLSFCFVDPFGLDIHFDTIQTLGNGRAMDFLILLALGMDATRNWGTYLKPENTKVGRFLGDNAWRPRWATAERHGTSPIQFLANEYALAMTRLGYLTKSLDQMIEVRTYDNNMRLYYLAFFSKNERGYQFWEKVKKYSTDQLGLGF
jgi:three-Cys-motif partner protein